MRSSDDSEGAIILHYRNSTARASAGGPGLICLDLSSSAYSYLIIDRYKLLTDCFLSSILNYLAQSVASHVRPAPRTFLLSPQAAKGFCARSTCAFDLYKGSSHSHKRVSGLSDTPTHKRRCRRQTQILRNRPSSNTIPCEYIAVAHVGVCADSRQYRSQPELVAALASSAGAARHDLGLRHRALLCVNPYIPRWKAVTLRQGIICNEVFLRLRDKSNYDLFPGTLFYHLPIYPGRYYNSPVSTDHISRDR